MKSDRIIYVCPQDGDTIPCSVCPSGQHVHVYDLALRKDEKVPSCPLHRKRLVVKP